MRLYHGSDVMVDKPVIVLNTGFSDLGRGFYVTDDMEVARRRAQTRARRCGAEHGVVSVFELDEGCVPWAMWGACQPSLSGSVGGGPFGLRFEESKEGVVAWARYIAACRMGNTEVVGLGQPSIVRAWIATEEIEMVCAGFAPAEDIADFVDPASLTVQYCFANQDVIEWHLAFVEAIPVS